MGKVSGGSAGNRRTDYSDIIDLPHHVSSRHPQMSMHDRAAQFAPFAALSGFGESVQDAESAFGEYAEYGGLNYSTEEPDI